MVPGWLLDRMLILSEAHLRAVLIEYQAHVISESDGFAEQQDGAAPGLGFCVQDEKAVDGTGPPVGRLGAGAFQRKGMLFDAAQGGAQVGYHLLRIPGGS